MERRIDKGGDLRVRKTQQALYLAIIKMLNQRNFNNITVHDICACALVSRAAFYSHFRDKYDLLEYLLLTIRKDIVKDVFNMEELESTVNKFVDENQKLISNVVKDANSETLALIRGFMSDIVELAIKSDTSEISTERRIVLFNFFIGGLVNQLTWIVENDYPPEVKMISPYLYKMLELITVCAEQGDKF